jgi:hypothetical protein
VIYPAFVCPLQESLKLTGESLGPSFVSSLQKPLKSPAYQMTAEKNLGMPVTDGVIGILVYFSDLERRAYLNAIYIVGLKLYHNCIFL